MYNLYDITDFCSDCLFCLIVIRRYMDIQFEVYYFLQAIHLSRVMTFRGKRGHRWRRVSVFSYFHKSTRTLKKCVLTYLTLVLNVVIGYQVVFPI